MHNSFHRGEWCGRRREENAREQLAKEKWIHSSFFLTYRLGSINDLHFLARALGEEEIRKSLIRFFIFRIDPRTNVYIMSERTFSNSLLAQLLYIRSRQRAEKASKKERQN